MLVLILHYAQSTVYRNVWHETNMVGSSELNRLLCEEISDMLAEKSEALLVGRFYHSGPT